jgi:hypothetical protein
MNNRNAKKVIVCFEKIILNDDNDISIFLKMDNRRVMISKTLIDENSILLDNNGKGPNGSIAISEWWIIQRGLYHLRKEF